MKKLKEERKVVFTILMKHLQGNDMERYSIWNDLIKTIDSKIAELRKIKSINLINN